MLVNARWSDETVRSWRRRPPKCVMKLIDIIAWGIEVECHGDYYMYGLERNRAFSHTPYIPSRAHCVSLCGTHTTTCVRTAYAHLDTHLEVEQYVYTCVRWPTHVPSNPRGITCALVLTRVCIYARHARYRMYRWSGMVTATRYIATAKPY